MPLPSRAQSNDCLGTAAAVAEGEMSIEVSIFDPSSTITVPYNATTDTGGYNAPALIASAVPARISFLRYPHEASSLAEWSVSRMCHIEIPLSAVATLIPSGSIIRVTKIGPKDDPSLPMVTFTVTTAVAASIAIVRTIFCTSMLATTPVVV
jgi:hypothetical protein